MPSDRHPRLTAWLYRWHQRIGLAAGLAIIAWGLSGLSHPLITRINPQPAAFAPPGETVDATAVQPLATLLRNLGIDEFQRARLLNWEGTTYLRLEQRHQVQFIEAHTGLISPRTDSDYAAWLARHYLNDRRSAIRSVREVRTFDEDYLFINKLLPVYRVDFERDDNMRVYIETSTARLASLNNNTKSATATWFRQLHSWRFIENETLRLTLMVALLTLGAATTVAGLVLFVRKWRRGQLRRAPTRLLRLHRVAGALAAIAAFGFTLSGGYHLIHKAVASAPPERPKEISPLRAGRYDFDWQQLLASQGRLVFVDLLTIDGDPYLRLVPQASRGKSGAHHHKSQKTVSKPTDRYLRAGDGAATAEPGRDLALSLATRYSGLPRDSVRDIVEITRFGGEYGFINKRLPVYGVNYKAPGNPTFYVENLTGALAARVTDSDRVEGFSFAYIHKWHFLDFLGRGARDALLATAAAAIVLVFALGLWIYGVNGYRRRSAALSRFVQPGSEERGNPEVSG